MFQAWELILAAGLPVVGLAGPYTAEGMAQHLAADLCRWFEFSSGWWRADLAQDLSDGQAEELIAILEGMG